MRKNLNLLPRIVPAQTPLRFMFFLNESNFSQVENYITRPLSCEGPSDSGVSVSSEYICPDGDNTSLTAQSQSVSLFLMLALLKKFK